MSNYPTNTTELLTRIEAAWDQLLAVVDQLNPETLTIPAVEKSTACIQYSLPQSLVSF